MLNVISYELAFCHGTPSVLVQVDACPSGCLSKMVRVQVGACPSGYKVLQRWMVLVLVGAALVQVDAMLV